MKATLTFNLPEESVEHEQAVNAGKVLDVLLEFNNYISALDKYESTQNLTTELIETIQNNECNKIDAVIETRNMLFKLFDDKGISIF